MHRDACAALDRRQLLELDVEPVRGREGARRDERIPAVELPPLDTGQAERDTLARGRALDGRVVHLHAADAHFAAARRNASVSPSPIEPDQSVPVTTVPIPLSVKTRST